MKKIIAIAVMTFSLSTGVHACPPGARCGGTTNDIRVNQNARPLFVVIVYGPDHYMKVYSAFNSKSSAEKWAKGAITDNVKYQWEVVETIRINAPSR